MATFGKQAGGGRRRAARSATVLPATVVSIGWSNQAALLNISATGARLRVSSLPTVGQAFILKMDRIDVLAEVAWVKGDTIGVAFDEPLHAAQVKLLRRTAEMAGRGGLSAEEQQAIQDWSCGVAR